MWYEENGGDGNLVGEGIEVEGLAELDYVALLLTETSMLIILLLQPSATMLGFAEVLVSQIAAACLFILMNTYAGQKHKDFHNSASAPNHMGPIK
jgi:hypothetical protein